MFNIDLNLKKAILSEIDNSFAVLEMNEVKFKDSCSCSGGCGTYAPACSCCGYQH